MPEATHPSDGRPLTLRDFDYPVPESLVAHEPIPERDQARLLVRQAEGTLRHVHLGDLTSELRPGTRLFLNDTKVFPCRLLGQLASGGQVELFLLKEEADGCWSALGRPLRKLKVGRPVDLGHGLRAEVTKRQEETVTIRFNLAGEDLGRWLDHHGYIPLPPYIKRPQAEPSARSADRERYQTVYARERGSVAAPTAGLHFTERLLARLQAGGVHISYVSLHVGAGTFLPVKSERLADHRMHAETYRIPAATLEELLSARAEGHPVVAVGTTTLRCLEDLYRRAGGDPQGMRALADSWHTTELFLHPKTAQDRYRPWVIDGLFTNFHQPCSTLFMLVSALIGLDEAQALYREAIAREYRLYSYGDASLLWL